MFISLGLVTSGIAASSGFRLLEANRHFPCAERCLVVDILGIVAPMRAVTCRACPSLERLVDMEIMKIPRAVTKISQFCGFLKFHDS